MAYITISVKTWYLRKEKSNATHLQFPLKGNIISWHPSINEEYLKVYREVGDAWGWTGRILMDKDKLSNWLKSDQCQLYLLKVKDKIAGFIEFDCTDKEHPEIVYFGLISDFIGKKLGLPFLTHATHLMESNSEYVWLHTCEYDHPSAIKVYEKAGFSVFKESIDEEPYDEDFLKEFKEKYKSN